MKLVIGTDNNQIFNSIDGGITWNFLNTIFDSTISYADSIASSADGTILICSISSGSIWVSLDSGLHWTKTIINGANNGIVCCSADGSKMTAAQNTTNSNSNLYTSSDSGTTWINILTSPAGETFMSIASDAQETSWLPVALPTLLAVMFGQV